MLAVHQPALCVVAVVHQLQVEERGCPALAADDLQVSEYHCGRFVCLCDQDALAASPQRVQRRPGVPGVHLPEIRLQGRQAQAQRVRVRPSRTGLSATNQ